MPLPDRSPEHFHAQATEQEAGHTDTHWNTGRRITREAPSALREDLDALAMRVAALEAKPASRRAKA